ncbi:MAG: TIGR02281 family clan AA aspartic protease [Pseudomonadota bacterium]|nr:TIGR02281 family clan AA aspartic protease [Pseudomonadota bacterium]
MFGKTLLFAGAVVVFALIVVPRHDEPDSVQSDGTTYSPTAAAMASGPATGSWSAGGDHTLSRAYDGHFYAAATLNGTGVRMLVDTGASVIALTGADAASMGLFWDDAAVRPVARGASGAVYGVPVTIDEVEIGGMVRRNIDAIIVPEGLDISLLGQSYLSKLGTVEISGDSMVISDS